MYSTYSGLNMGGVVKVQKIATVNSWLQQRSLSCYVAKGRSIRHDFRAVARGVSTRKSRRSTATRRSKIGRLYDRASSIHACLPCPWATGPGPVPYRTSNLGDGASPASPGRLKSLLPIRRRRRRRRRRRHKRSDRIVPS